MRCVLENTDHLHIKQAEVSEIIVEDGVIKGVKTVSGAHCLIIYIFLVHPYDTSILNLV